ncbi:MAG: hypothetical protein AB4060_02535 [Crocosphaera sp.]
MLKLIRSNIIQRENEIKHILIDEEKKYLDRILTEIEEQINHFHDNDDGIQEEIYWYFHGHTLYDFFNHILGFLISEFREKRENCFEEKIREKQEELKKTKTNQEQKTLEKQIRELENQKQHYINICERNSYQSDLEKSHRYCLKNFKLCVPMNRLKQDIEEYYEQHFADNNNHP